MPEKFVDGLSNAKANEMIDLLNARLASATDLTLAVKQAHWNIKGHNFIGLHELLDDVATRLRGISDLMAERAVILGGHAKGTLQVAHEATSLEPYPVELTRIDDHIAELKTRFMSFGAELRKAIDAAGDAGDEDTADLFTEASRTIDKDAWFIGANGSGN